MTIWADWPRLLKKVLTVVSSFVFISSHLGLKDAFGEYFKVRKLGVGGEELIPLFPAVPLLQSESGPIFLKNKTEGIVVSRGWVLQYNSRGKVIFFMLSLCGFLKHSFGHFEKQDITRWTSWIMCITYVVILCKSHVLVKCCGKDTEEISYKNGLPLTSMSLSSLHFLPYVEVQTVSSLGQETFILFLLCRVPRMPVAINRQ